MPLSFVVRTLVALVVFASFTVLERRVPLRRPRHATNRRLAINVALGALAFGAIALAYRAMVLSSVRWSADHEIGVVRWIPMPRWIAAPLAIVLLDYTLWMWHWLNHRVAFLWRFHAAHHADLDLDASTALRFHPGEMLLSLPVRAAQVAVIGVSLGPLVAWELLVFACTQFHHSNLALPERVDRALSRAVITPRLHGIHHSRRPGELHANFGTILALWDRLHRVRVVDVPQDTIDVGLPGQAPHALGLPASLAVPFHRRAPARAIGRDQD
jgi:sterol desaturase/sphingolipid hydroxylase (fatty acid hydroxylase superfamily)